MTDGRGFSPAAVDTRAGSPISRGQASYEVTAGTVKFLGKREGNGGAPIGELPPAGYEDDDLLPS